MGNEWKGICTVCGGGMTGHKRRMCSAICRSRGRSIKLKSVSCKRCNNQFLTARITLKYCSAKCRSENKEEGRAKPNVKKCSHCGENYEARYDNVRCCSSSCAVKWKAENRKEKPQPQGPMDRERLLSCLLIYHISYTSIRLY